MNLKSYEVNKFGTIGNGYYDIAVAIPMFGTWLLTQYIRKYLKKTHKFIVKNDKDRNDYGFSNAIQLGSFDGSFVVFSKTRIMLKTEKLLTPYLEKYK